MSHQRKESVINEQSMVQAGRVYEQLRETRPVSKSDLRNYLKVFLGLSLPEKPMCPDHNSPLDYVWYVWNADFGEANRGNADCVVWANRGGGKTRLAAAATLLDCIFKVPVQVRILGGSAEQASQMYNYLTGFLENGYGRFLDGTIRKNRCDFAGGSSVEVLTQSARSVRGQHIQKLRCDEVELFDRDVFNAAKFTTKSNENSLAGMEIISTMHRPYGLMQDSVDSARKGGVPVFQWCLWDVIERCVDRSCSRCPLWSDCRGVAKKAKGFFGIDDAITQMRRASRAGWESEMLCARPNLENVVFDEFDPERNIGDVDYDPNLPVYRAMDFGFANPFVCLWIQVDSEGVVRVFDEYVRSRATIQSHCQQVKERTPCDESQVAGTFCDPAGAGRNDVTGTSAVSELAAGGIPVRYRSSGILEGIEMVRRSIRSGDGVSRLKVSRRCVRLTESLRCYHYPETSNGEPAGELPEKDGVYDHPIDALRYFFVNYSPSGNLSKRRY